MRSIVPTVLALVGCTVDRPVAPCVRLVADATTEDVAYASTWMPVGFDFSRDESGLDECAQRWYVDGITDCQITIGLVRVPQLRERTGTNARTSRADRRIEIDASMTGFALAVAVAHEVGHVVLDTAEHTRGGVMGGADVILSVDDKALACRAIGICVE